MLSVARCKQGVVSLAARRADLYSSLHAWALYFAQCKQGSHIYAARCTQGIRCSLHAGLGFAAPWLNTNGPLEYIAAAFSIYIIQ